MRTLRLPAVCLVLTLMSACGATPPPATAKVSMLPKNYIKLEGKDATRMLKLMEAVEDHDDVQNVWSNFDIDEKEIEASLA